MTFHDLNEAVITANFHSRNPHFPYLSKKFSGLSKIFLSDLPKNAQGQAAC